jgi:predicted Zn-dependent peptidase
MIFLSGTYGETELDLVKNVLGSWDPGYSGTNHKPGAYQVSTEPGYQEIDGPQEHQAAIRIGRKLFTQHHPDYNGLFVLNTILGGYFGSRLMTEVRENLGLTYGIYSGIDSFAEDGCLYISTETTTQNIEKVIQAIQDEIQQLQTTLVGEEELQMAKNYLMGHLMTQLDGPFASLDYIKTMKIERLPDSAFADTVRTIREITPERLQELAVRYMDLASWSTIVVR